MWRTNVCSFFSALLSLFILLHDALADFCGNNRIPFGLEVHKNGRPTLLCSRPNCFEKKYAECDERPQRLSCPGNRTWVGGLEKPPDDRLYVQCCEYELLEKYGELLFEKVLIRPGEFFEGEEKTADDDDEVKAFDLISNLRLIKDAKGIAYEMSIHRFHCGRVPSTPPVWLKSPSWPFHSSRPVHKDI